MKTILVTGAKGFVGRHLGLALERTKRFRVLPFDLPSGPQELETAVARADAVVHLAGVNRPKDEGEFVTGNVDLTRDLCARLSRTGRKIPVAFSSSIQAALDNPYGRSKLAAEDILRDYGRETGSPVRIFRLPNIFGKWSRPEYNTVVATFCHQIARGLPVKISRRDSGIRFVYVDDVVRAFAAFCEDAESAPEVAPEFSITVGDLHDRLLAFHQTWRKGRLPDLSDRLTRYLYSTFLSFKPGEDWSYPVDLKTDDRGWLFELVQSPHAGQIFVSRTRPGITRGNHYHDTKIEKFCVVQGEGVIRFRKIGAPDVLTFPVSDRQIRIVDIPPGHTHSIENTGTREMITIFWANEIFDPERPDTHGEPVLASVRQPQ